MPTRGLFIGRYTSRHRFLAEPLVPKHEISIKTRSKLVLARESLYSLLEIGGLQRLRPLHHQHQRLHR
jgi:hypothetical protein